MCAYILYVKDFKSQKCDILLSCRVRGLLSERIYIAYSCAEKVWTIYKLRYNHMFFWLGVREDLQVLTSSFVHKQ